MCRANLAEYMTTVYYKPWCRVGPYAVGLILGYILHVTRGKYTMTKVGGNNHGNDDDHDKQSGPNTASLSLHPRVIRTIKSRLGIRSRSIDRLAGLVVKASASGTEDPGFESRLRRDVSRSSHTSGYTARRLALQGQRWDWSARCQYTVTG